MASTPVILVFMLFFAANEATSETNHSSIRLGSLLSPVGNHTSWSSSSGHFAFGFYPKGEGYAIGIWLLTHPNNTIVWTAKRDNPPLPSNSTLTLTKHGGLLLHGGEEDPENLARYVSGPVVSASMLDSGNFVLYGKDYEVVWSSFSEPTDTILGGQNLTGDDELFSSMSESDHFTGHFSLANHYGGQIVAYPVNSPHEEEDGYPFSEFYELGYSYLSLSIEGSLCINFEEYVRTSCLFSSTDLGKKSQNTTTSIYRATLGDDGNFRLYVHQFEGTTNSSVKLLWEAVTDKCEVKGLCGLNSYCSNMTGKVVCECYPGFIPYKSRGNDTLFLECKQINSRDNCESPDKDSTVSYNMTSLKDIYWYDSPYLVVPMKMEACKKSCLEDYDCGGVLYTNGTCKIYRLPLLYGRRLQNSSTVALIKMPSENVISPAPNLTVPSPRELKVLVDDKKSLLMILDLTLGFISFFGLVIVVYIFFTYKRQVYKYTMLSRSENLGFTEDYSLRSFSFDELVKSTGGFTEEVGRGSFGAVYRGTMAGSNRRIAVKRLEKIVDQGEKEFHAEISAIARTHHRNLVKLIGFCIDGSKKLLVYEYVSNGSLANLLFKSPVHLPWSERLKITLDVAKGVLYLHEECEVRIIHCNIKPQNILIDEARNAKISDFGFARLLKTECSRMNARDDQSSRYLAPEWQKDESMSVKVDIYSFGVVLLEIVCRRRNIDINVSSPEEILLSSWVHQCFAAGKLYKLVADGDGEDVDWKILERMVRVGLWCVQDKPSLRPSMKNVILMLEGLKDIPVPPSPALLIK